jgi:hypothetical protein
LEGNSTDCSHAAEDANTSSSSSNVKAQQPEQPLAYWVILPTDYVEQQQQGPAVAPGELHRLVQFA